MRSASAMVASRLRPFSRPSRAMSVKMIAATPASSKRCAISSAVTCEVSAQPSTATLPSRASRPTATRPGNFFAAPFTSSGSRTAAVPMMTRAMPLASQASTVARSRMPPPSCTGMVTAFSIASTACAFIGLPAKAPSRSTTCRYSKPCAAKAARLRRRIEVEHGGARHVALLEAHALAVLQIDGGKEDHGFHFKKFEIRASPKRWLFSG